MHKKFREVMNQTYRDIEYIVIDGASHDDTARIAESYVKKFCEREGRIEACMTL